MALIYDKYYKAIPSSFKVTGAVPIDLRQVVLSLNNLYGQQSQTDKTWEDEKGNLITYNGMLVSVLDSSAVYLCIDESHPYVEASWKKVSGSGGDADLTDVYNKIHEVSTYIINVSTDVSDLKFVVSNVSLLVSNVSTVLYDVSSRVDKLEINIANVSNAIDDVSDRLSKFGKAFIYRGKGYYNSSTTVTVADASYIVLADGSEGIIPGLRGGDVYQTSDNKEWVYVEEATHAGEKWVELGLPFQFNHYVNASTHSQFVNVSTLREDDEHTTIIVDVSKSILDSSNFEETGFVTDAQLKVALSWVVLD